MKVGISLNPRDFNDCWIAEQLERVLRNGGADIVRTATGSRTESDELRRSTHIIFLSPPVPDTLRMLQSEGAHASLFFSWSDLSFELIETLPEFDVVVCPSKAAYRHLKSLNDELTNLIKIPFSAAPATRLLDKDLDPARIGAICYLTAATSDCSATIKQMAELVDELPNVYLTFLQVGTLSSTLEEELLKVTVDAKGRIAVAEAGSPSEQQKLHFACHDVLLWSSVFDDVGYPGLLAAEAGLPCVAYDHPVAAETVKDNVNGILVPCEFTFNPVMVPTVVPARFAFSQAAAELLSEPYEIERLASGASRVLGDRRSIFERMLQRVFSDE